MAALLVLLAHLIPRTRGDKRLSSLRWGESNTVLVARRNRAEATEQNGEELMASVQRFMMSRGAAEYRVQEAESISWTESTVREYWGSNGENGR